ncbi:MAG: hypothetical protein ACM3SQ_13185 [Betaproteobacteria bacterium]
MRSRRLLAVLLIVLAAAAALWSRRDGQAASQTLPTHLSDRDFWRLVSDLSERGGYFRSDNLISNERQFQHVIPELTRRLPPGGVYVGVGPDQNFTYIVALRPRMAFVVDIRRQNMLLHLLYKAIIEQSKDRADFLSRLFSRPHPGTLSRASTAQELFAAYESVAPTDERYKSNLRSVLDRLEKHHKFPLTPEDVHGIEYVYSAFYTAGPDLRYSFPRGFGARWFPSYAELMTETDSDGAQLSYLASEPRFQTLKRYEESNLLVPVVGDFGGEKALRRVGDYLREHGASVSAFYTSNVEQYLFQSDGWKRFFDNVASMPIDDHGTFIRSFFNRGYGFQRGFPDARSTTLLDSIGGLLADVKAGRIQSYYDVIEHSTPSEGVVH